MSYPGKGVNTGLSICNQLYELHHEQTCSLHMLKQGLYQLHCNPAADQGLCFRFIDSPNPKFQTSVIYDCAA